MKKQILCLFLALTVWVSVVGCSKSEVLNAIDQIESRLPQISQIATSVLLFVDPVLVPLVGPAFSFIAADGKLLQQLIADYKVAPNASLLARINALYEDIEKNQQAILVAVGVKNLGKNLHIQQAIALIGIILAGLASFVQNHAPKTLQRALSAMTTEPVEDPGMSARDIAHAWNKSCGSQKTAKIPVPKWHGMPFTGR